MVITGDIGKLRVIYQQAATIRRWTVTSDEVLGRRFTLTGLVGTYDRYWSTQSPISLGIWMGGKVWWVWARTEPLLPIIAGEPIAIQLFGEPETAQGF